MFQSAEVPQKISKADFEQAVESLRVELVNAQFDLREQDFPVIVLLSGDDRPACSQALKSMHEWMDQRDIETNALPPPEGPELQYPAFWRYWLRLPRRGRIGVFIGGWDVDQISGRLRDGLEPAELDRHFDRIRAFEGGLAADGALILKYWFHLPKKKLRKRIKQAKKDPQRMWWLRPEDKIISNRYDELMPLAERLIRKTNTGDAPWTIIGSQDVYYRNLAFATHLRDRLVERIKLRAAAKTAPPARVEAEHTKPPPGRVHTVLDSVDLASKLEKKAYDSQLETLQAEIRRLTYRAREKGIASVLAFEGWDAAGKGGVIRRLTFPIDPRIFQVNSVAAPTEEERAHHYLWRFWTKVPPAGRIVIFDRTWYGRVLVERVEGFTPVPVWRRAYSEINDFEEQLAASGALIQKFWLHIDPDEQLRRFEAREDTPFKKYKITEEDYRNREKTEAYTWAVDDMVAQTSTDYAPWHLIPANDKRFARIKVLETYANELRKRL